MFHVKINFYRFLIKNEINIVGGYFLKLVDHLIFQKNNIWISSI